MLLRIHTCMHVSTGRKPPLEFNLMTFATVKLYTTFEVSNDWSHLKRGRYQANQLGFEPETPRFEAWRQ